MRDLEPNGFEETRLKVGEVVPLGYHVWRPGLGGTDMGCCRRANELLQSAGVPGLRGVTGALMEPPPCKLWYMNLDDGSNEERFRSLGMRELPSVGMGL